MKKWGVFISTLCLLSTLVSGLQIGEVVNVNMSISSESCGCGHSNIAKMGQQTYGGYKLISPNGSVILSYYEPYCERYSPYEDYSVVLYQPNITFIPELNGTYIFCTVLTDLLVYEPYGVDICVKEIGGCYVDDCINVTIGNSCTTEYYDYLIPGWFNGWYNKIENWEIQG